MKNLTKSDFMNITLPLPSIEYQILIVTNLDKLLDLIVDVKSKLAS